MQISAVSAMSSSSGPLSWSPPRPATEPGTAMSADQLPHSAALAPAEQPALPKPVAVPHMTTSDRAAVAGATGVYLSPGGAATPAATNVSWESISRYVEQRHRVADATAMAAAYHVPVADGVSRIDVLA